MVNAREESPVPEPPPAAPRQRRLWAAAITVTLVGFAVTWWFMEPAPPDRIVIASGRPEGAYHRFATEYAAVLEQRGIEVEVRTTAGSVENYRLLLDDPDVDVAIVQGGTAPPVIEEGRLFTLTGLYLEPVWVLVRRDAGPIPADLRDLRGRRIAVGDEGSGTRAVVDQLLPLNGVEDGADGTRFVATGGTGAATELQAGRVDAAVLVLSATHPLITTLLADEELAVLSLSRNEAYRRRLSSLSAVTLPEGVLDFERNLPDRDLAMIAPVAQLVATDELHVAIVPLLLEAAQQSHARGDVLTEPGLFPSTKYAEFPVSPAARRWFRSGPSFLFRWLPFSVASVLDRGKILLLPALTLLFPLLKIAPPLIRWRIRSSIYTWYSILRAIDGKLRDGANSEELREHLASLARMQHELDDVSVPLSYMEEFYNLRMHLDLVRRNLEGRLETTIAVERDESGA